MLSLSVKLTGFAVGYLYPTYCALKTLDRKSNTHDDYVLWVTFLIVALTMVIFESWGVVACAESMKSLGFMYGDYFARGGLRDGLTVFNALGVDANRIPAYRMLKVLFCAWMVNPRFKGAITLYKKALAPVFTQLSPSIDRTTEQLKKGDFAAIQEELGPQFAKVQELVKKHGPEAIERAMSMASKGMSGGKKPEESKAE